MFAVLDYSNVWVSIIELSTLLLNQKADLTIATTSGDTILHAGVYGNNSTIVDLLLAAGKSFFFSSMIYFTYC